MSGRSYVDGLLVDWGALLFNQTPVKATPPKKGLTGVPLRPNAKGKGGGAVSLRADAQKIRGKLGSIAKKAPEVMVKITPGVPKGMKQIKDHLDYISRNGKIDLEDQDGDVLKGREDLRGLRDEWQFRGQMVPEDGETREAFNIVMSMPAGTDELAVTRAARDFAAREFEGHQYVMALHTFETDPDPTPSKHPHVHLSVKARADDGTRLNPRKADLQRWREGFAEALREHGVEAAATNRQQRLKRERPEKQAVRQMRDRGVEPSQIGHLQADPLRIAKAKRSEKKVLKAYREMSKALATSDDVEDRKLAANLLDTLSNGRVAAKGSRLQPETDRDQTQGRGDDR